MLSIRRDCFWVVVGKSGRSRKGTSWRNIKNVLATADRGCVPRIMGGLSSGEGLISAVGDATTDEKGNVVGGIADKRLTMVEEEFVRVLQVKGRAGSILSTIVRQAWDSEDLRTMTKKPLVATGAHVSILANITIEECAAH